jgi:hypothetical protein
MTELKVIEMVESLLKEHGFNHICKTHSAHSATISAEKGAHRLVMHITDQVELPYNSGQNEKVPLASAIKVTARLPGLSPNAEGQVIQRGHGGAVRAAEGTKRHRQP